MTAPTVHTLRGGQGYFQVIITHPDGQMIDVTFFRGVPTKVDAFSSADPFGDSSASLSFESITSYDSPGSGDLFWLVPWAQVSIFWFDLIDEKPVRRTDWVWEGFIVSEEIGTPYQLQCKGTLYIYDNTLAAPFYPDFPVPYEVLMARMFNVIPTRWNKPLRIDWPEGWNVKVPSPRSEPYLWFLKPWGITTGSLWSGLTTRNTGGWEPVLTGFLQTLLTTMFTPDGDQWTIMKEYGRRPVLKVRQTLTTPDANTLVVHNGVPGVTVSVSRDYSQSANVVYGSGEDLAGSVFNGAQVSPDGESTWFEPFAAQPQVYPMSASNPRRIASVVRKESRITFPGGIDELTARDVALTQLRRFADPGLLGSITLNTDPLLNDQPFNRILITAGQQIMVRNLRGFDVLFHISTVNVSVADGTVSLTVDTKFRDALTAAEVKARTRDAMHPVNLLKAGQISAVTNDVLKPWSNAGGSGVVPSGGKNSDATPFFRLMPPGMAFPWYDWTRRYPPRNHPELYIKVSRKGARATDRWQDYGWTNSAKRSIGVPIKGAQQANIRLTQVMAVDKNGNPLNIRFHLGFYSSPGISSTDMPMIPVGAKGIPNNYQHSERYPFFQQAFNTVRASGEENDQSVRLPNGVVQYAAWGTYQEPAGYSPGTLGSGASKTGRLVDEDPWVMNAGVNDPSFSVTSAADNARNKTAGMWYAMIFQDDVQEAYFIGRCFRAPMGTGGDSA